MTDKDLYRLKPTAKHLIVHLRPGQQITPAGIIIPPDSQQVTQHGDVLSIGPDVQHIQPGDQVLLSLHCGTHLCDLQNTPVLLVTQSDVQAILETDP